MTARSALSTTAARDAFLGRLRAQLGGADLHAPLRPLLQLGDEVPPIAYTADLSDLPAAFAAAAAPLGVLVRRVTVDGIPALVREACDAHGIKRAALSADPECVGVEEALRALGVDVVARDDRTALGSADLGVTGAMAGIALTGTVVVDCARAGTRTVSLLPPIHLALVRTATLVATPGDFLRNLGEWLPKGLPSNLVFVTGPSRSGDIELYLARGVHGPRDVWVGLVDD